MLTLERPAQKPESLVIADFPGVALYLQIELLTTLWAEPLPRVALDNRPLLARVSPGAIS